MCTYKLKNIYSEWNSSYSKSSLYFLPISGFYGRDFWVLTICSSVVWSRHFKWTCFTFKVKELSPSWFWRYQVENVAQLHRQTGQQEGKSGWCHLQAWKQSGPFPSPLPVILISHIPCNMPLKLYHITTLITSASIWTKFLLPWRWRQHVLL